MVGWGRLGTPAAQSRRLRPGLAPRSKAAPSYAILPPGPRYGANTCPVPPAASRTVSILHPLLSVPAGRAGGTGDATRTRSCYARDPRRAPAARGTIRGPVADPRQPPPLLGLGRWAARSRAGRQRTAACVPAGGPHSVVAPDRPGRTGRAARHQLWPLGARRAPTTRLPLALGDRPERLGDRRTATGPARRPRVDRRGRVPTGQHMVHPSAPTPPGRRGLAGRGAPESDRTDRDRDGIAQWAGVGAREQLGPGTPRRPGATRGQLCRARAAGRVDSHRVGSHQHPGISLVGDGRDLAGGRGLDRRGGEPGGRGARGPAPLGRAALGADAAQRRQCRAAAGPAGGQSYDCGRTPRRRLVGGGLAARGRSQRGAASGGALCGGGVREPHPAARSRRRVPRRLRKLLGHLRAAKRFALA